MEAQKIETLEKVTLTEIDSSFLKKVLTPYRPHATYLRRAFLQTEAEKGIQGLTAKGEFTIADSCYIDDTGHFNAVEYNICYNQLGYSYIAHCIANQLIRELEDYDVETFLKKQLANFLIAKIGSSFPKMLNAKKFYGTFGISSIKKTARFTFLQTYCIFHDDYNGRSAGEVSIAILPANFN
jgi:hypothetical protein